MKCYTCNGEHLTAQQCRTCHALSLHRQGIPPRHVFYTHASPTDSQLDYVRRLRGNVGAASRMTREGISHYITTLKNDAAKARDAMSHHSGPAREYVPGMLLDMIPVGYYAVRASDEEPFTFLRVSRPSKGRWAMHTKIQSQHSENLIMRMSVAPNGRQTLYSGGMVNSRRIDWHLKTLLSSVRPSAIAYGQELGSCCICGKSLTDMRSKHYGIGPDCERNFPEIVAEVDATQGEYVHH